MVFEFLSVPHDEEEAVEETADTEEQQETEQEADASAAASEDITKKEKIISESPVFKMYLEELKDIPSYEEQIEYLSKFTFSKDSVNPIKDIKKLSRREHLDLIEKCLVHRKRYLPTHFLYSNNKLLNILLKTIWFIGNPKFIHEALKILMR